MKIKYTLLIVLAVTASLASARMLADGLFGTWKYTVSNVPPEYESGSMTFEEKGGKAVGYLGDGATKSEMKELNVSNDKVTFKLDFQGGLITFDLTQKGDSLKGMVVTNDGDFPITAFKSK